MAGWGRKEPGLLGRGSLTAGSPAGCLSDRRSPSQEDTGVLKTPLLPRALVTSDR